MSEHKHAPAFPLPNWDETPWPQGTPADFGTGLTMRDWFAGQAIVGAAQYQSCQPGPDGMAQRAYELADAMLKARVSS